MQHHITWLPSEESPPCEGLSVPVWMCLSDRRIVAGTFVEEVDGPVVAVYWLGVDRQRYAAGEVQYWTYREDTDPVPDPPR